MQISSSQDQIPRDRSMHLLMKALHYDFRYCMKSPSGPCQIQQDHAAGQNETENLPLPKRGSAPRSLGASYAHHNQCQQASRPSTAALLAGQREHMVLSSRQRGMKAVGWKDILPALLVSSVQEPSLNLHSSLVGVRGSRETLIQGTQNLAWRVLSLGGAFLLINIQSQILLPCTPSDKM